MKHPFLRNVSAKVGRLQPKLELKVGSVTLFITTLYDRCIPVRSASRMIWVEL